jgi:hypothetical protein
MRHLIIQSGTVGALLLALVAPFITLILFKGQAFGIDVSIFQSWSRCLRAESIPYHEICSPFAINYPTIGLWASAGALWGLELLRGLVPTPTLYFQYYLAVVDSLNIALMYILLRGLQVSGAAWLTLLFSLLPSTRAGASLWGQIDSVSQFFLSLGFVCGLQGLKVCEEQKDGRSLLYLTLLGLCIGCATLTKQLAFFSLPSLTILWLILAVHASRTNSIRSIVLSAISACALMITLDQLSPTPPGYYGSSLFYILSTGSDHGGIVSAAGVNMYPLLHIPSGDSSKASYTVFSLGTIPIRVTPLYFGLTCFFGALALSAWWLGRLARRLREAPPTKITTTLLLFAALCNLFMNTLLSGTHERYLYHYGFFVFPVVVLLIQKRLLSPLLFLVCIGHLSLYGTFVYSLIIGAQSSTWAVTLRQLVAGLNICISLYALWALRRAGQVSARSASTTMS